MEDDEEETNYRFPDLFEIDANLPDNFDAAEKWPECKETIYHVRDQGKFFILTEDSTSNQNGLIPELIEKLFVFTGNCGKSFFVLSGHFLVNYSNTRINRTVFRFHCADSSWQWPLRQLRRIEFVSLAVVKRRINCRNKL